MADIKKLAPVLMSLGSVVLTAWLTDQLPRKGLPTDEIEKRLKNITIALLAVLGINYIVERVTPSTSVMVERQTEPEIKLFRW